MMARTCAHLEGNTPLLGGVKEGATKYRDMSGRDLHNQRVWRGLHLEERSHPTDNSVHQAGL